VWQLASSVAAGHLYTISELRGSWQAVYRWQALWQLAICVAVSKLYRWQAVYRWRAVWQWASCVTVGQAVYRWQGCTRLASWMSLASYVAVDKLECLSV
jgi:hypothetical protein